MRVFINGIGTMSAQKPWHHEALGEQPVSYAGDRLACIEPDYSKYFDVRQLRRMSRIIKMGMASGMDALREASIDIPHAIITGTSYGCLEDTGIFLTKMIENQEQALNPTPFIQSTHNTVGSQIALLLQCQGYNQTYTQRAFSFESALIDASMSLEDDPQQFILAGAVDEITTTSHRILQRFDIFRTGSTSSLQLFKDKVPGTLNGEGSAFFVLSATQGTDAVAIENVVTLYKPSAATLSNAFASCVGSSLLRLVDIDLVLVGKSGHITEDRDTDYIVSNLFPSSSHAVFKHLTGEFPTATALAMALASRIIQGQHIPDWVIEKDVHRPPKNVLIYNPYFGIYHSLILLRAC